MGGGGGSKQRAGKNGTSKTREQDIYSSNCMVWNKRIITKKSYDPPLRNSIDGTRVSDKDTTAVIRPSVLHHPVLVCVAVTSRNLDSTMHPNVYAEDSTATGVCAADADI